mmetsp:Transcript_21613/g.33890  ORF Transcript_21613/g.33890 Transcript_21613/m.33890 type:complete len:671 (+) Transcript_21613:33-2045(+)
MLCIFFLQILHPYSEIIGYGITVAVFIAISALIGLATVFCVKGKSENYFVAGRSLPLWVVSATLASQSIDSNAILGNVDLSYKFHFYDGAVLPIGLGLSLILNGVFLASKINEDGALTLPDVYAKRYGKVVEVMVSLCTIISFLCLLAGNLVGMGNIIHYLYGDISLSASVWVSAGVVLAYTITGGLFSVAYTDVFQATIGWLGCITLAFYMISNAEQSAPPQSIGFVGYSYPDDETCALYDGVPCDNQDIVNAVDGTLRTCCYNETKYGPDGMDNGAYLYADAPVIGSAMTKPDGLTPFPNAIVFNWATIFVLAFGNLAALDFQARCMASKTPRTAVIGCLIAGCLTFFVGIPFSYLGAITRTFYGPDTARAAFETDTCSTILELPTCALWNPDPLAFLKLLTHEAPPVLGAWCLVGIVAASMSTCDGAILAMGTVFSHNIMRNFGCVKEQSLLLLARVASVPFAIISAAIASYYNQTGYLLVVAFDVVLASVVVPLFGCFYTKKPSPLAAFLAIWAGAITRVILEFTLPKDGFLIAPFNYPEFMNVGPAASSFFPSFFDVPVEDRWDPNGEKCDEVQFNDWSGVDSLISPLVCLIVFVSVQFLERNGPLIAFKEGGLFDGYLKEGQGGKEEEVTDHGGKEEEVIGIDLGQEVTDLGQNEKDNGNEDDA